jgi:hypothetical protein
MTLQELKSLVEHALSPAADVEVDRSGRSLFDLAREAVRQFANDRRADELIEMLVQIGQRNRTRNAEWWLSFLDLFEETRTLMPRLGVRLFEFFLVSPPSDPEACAYFLRFLAYLDAPIRWNALSGSTSLDKLAKTAPLVVAESLVWAKKFAEAEVILTTALSAGKVTPDDLNEIAARWSDVLGSSANNFIASVQTLGNPAQPAAQRRKPSEISSFGQRVRERNPKFYNRVSEGAVHA